MSSTSPTPRGGADCPGSCRGADAADFPGRVFSFSLKFDIKRPRLGQTHRTWFQPKQPREDQDPGRPSLGQGQEGWTSYATNWYGCDGQYRALASSNNCAVVE